MTTQVTTPDEARAAMARLLPLQPDLIKVFHDGWRYGDPARPDKPTMDSPTLTAIVDAARARGVPVVTHTVTREGAAMAARAGVTAIVHGIGDAELDRSTIALIKRRRMAYVPTMAVFEPQQARVLAPAELAMLSPADRTVEEARAALPQAAIAEWDARRWAILQTNLARLHRARVRIGIGTDAGITGVYHGRATLREIMLFTRFGFTPRQALRAATSVSAGIMGARDRGRIARGQRADLLLTGGRPDVAIADLYDVRAVYVGGRMVFARGQQGVSLTLDGASR